MKVLLAAATPQEIKPFLEKSKTHNSWDACITGVGLMAATFSLTKVLLEKEYELVLQAGVAGSFVPAFPPGALAVVQQEYLGDLGAEDHSIFKDIFELGLLGQDEMPFQNKALVNAMATYPFQKMLPAVTAITVHTVSGHAPTIAARARKFGAVLESMEGAALHYVCLKLGIPFLQLRAVSNFVEPRNRNNWQMPLAINNLNEQLWKWHGELTGK